MSAPKLRMDAYYYGFEETGADSIDRVLSAVACAGKAFHHTESWRETAAAWPGHEGDTPVAWIQNAANAAAAERANLLEALKALRMHDAAGGPCDVPGLKCGCIAAADSAIAKAEGRE